MKINHKCSYNKQQQQKTSKNKYTKKLGLNSGKKMIGDFERCSTWIYLNTAVINVMGGTAVMNTKLKACWSDGG